MKAILFAVLLAASPVMAEELSIAGGSGKTSTYSAVLGDIASECSTDELTLKEVNTNGGVDNLAMLRENKVKAAIIPTSLLFAAKMENATSVAQIRTLVPLHQEAVHLVVRSDTKTEGGISFGRFNLGGTTVQYTQAESLRDRPIGAVGGSAVDARILGDMLKIGWVVKQYRSNDELLRALQANDVDAAMFVAGQPSGTMAGLDGNRFKLLSLRGNQETATVYAPAKVQYPNLNGGQAVDSISQQALLVTRMWRSQEMQQKLMAFRACVVRSAPVLADKTGTHPVWQDETMAAGESKWPMYDFSRSVQK